MKNCLLSSVPGTGRKTAPEENPVVPSGGQEWLATVDSTLDWEKIRGFTRNSETKSRRVQMAWSRKRLCKSSKRAAGGERYRWKDDLLRKGRPANEVKIGRPHSLSGISLRDLVVHGVI